MMVRVMSSANSSGVVVGFAAWKSSPASSGSETSASTSQIRRLPASWRTVREKTALTAAPSSLGQVLEDALERVVERLDAEQAHAEPLRHGRQRALQLGDVAAAHPQMALRVDLDRLDRLELEQAGRQRPRAGRVDAHDERPVVQLLPDRARLPARRELAADHQVDARGELLDLLQDVRGDEDRARLRRESEDHVAQVE